MSQAPLVPDLVLRDAYRKVADCSNCYREKFIARTELIEAVKTELGPEYSHASADWLRDRIISCAKNPARHGGGWGNPKRPAPRKLRPTGNHSPEYLAHLDSDAWQEVRQAAFDRDGGRCRLCNSREQLEGHHRSYANLGRGMARELPDVTTLCRACHQRHHKN